MDWSGWTRQIVRLRRRSEWWRRLAADRGRSRDMWKARAIGAERELERLRRQMVKGRQKLPENSRVAA